MVRPAHLLLDVSEGMLAMTQSRATITLHPQLQHVRQGRKIQGTKILWRLSQHLSQMTPQDISTAPGGHV